MEPMTPRVRDPGTGRSARAARDHNERLVLSLLRRHGSLSKADIARRTRLSAQSATVITKRLEADGLLRRGDPVRGRVGQPSVPLSLDPGGAVALGCHVGRRNAEFMALDLCGDVLRFETLRYDLPLPDEVFAFLSRCLEPYRGSAAVCGLGFALPWHIWAWLDDEIAPARRKAMQGWQGLDIANEVAALADVPAFVCNDATAAARAENAFGLGRSLRDYATFFVGHFIGGGVVLDHKVREGRTGNAGAFGTMPSRSGGQLIERASLHVLRTLVEEGGGADPAAFEPQTDWSQLPSEPVRRWIATSAAALADASVAAACVFDLEAVVIEGQFPAAVRDRLVGAVRDEMAALDTRGIEPPAVVTGTIGPLARVRGAAALPLMSRFFVDE